MKYKSAPLRLILAALLATLVWTRDPWQEKPYTEWTLQDANGVLRASPWAQAVSLRELRIGGAEQSRPTSSSTLQPVYGDPMSRSQVEEEMRQRRLPSKYPFEDQFVVVWSSSLTVRQALWRRRQLLTQADLEQERQALSLPQGEYVISVVRAAPIQAGRNQGHPLSEEEVRRTSFLQVGKSTQKISPTRVVIFPVSADRPNESYEIGFYFPRETHGMPALSPTDRKVSFFFQIGAYSGVADFDLNKMVRNGARDL